MYNRLLELLHKLPQATQDKVTELAKADADRFCKKYELTLPDHTDTAYRFYLSKRVRFAWFNQVDFEHTDPVDIMDLAKIWVDYHERVGWMLNDDIQSKAPQRSTLLKEHFIQPLEEVVI